MNVTLCYCVLEQNMELFSNECSVMSLCINLKHEDCHNDCYHYVKDNTTT